MPDLRGGQFTGAQPFALDLPQRLANHVRAPVVFAVLQEFLDLRLQFAQAEEVMLRVAQLRRGAVNLRARFF